MIKSEIGVKKVTREPINFPCFKSYQNGKKQERKRILKIIDDKIYKYECSARNGNRGNYNIKIGHLSVLRELKKEIEK